MAEWRQRGYVPDSDDEDEELTGQRRHNDEEVEQNVDSTARVSQVIQDSHPVIPERGEQTPGTVDPATESQQSGFSGQNTVQPSSSTWQQPDDIPEAEQEADPVVIAGKSTAERLQDQLNHGLEIARKYATTPPPLQGHDLSIDISPLSSPLSSLGTISSPAEVSGVQTKTAEIFEKTLVATTTSTSDNVWGRAFRRRAPIQLHPYALEDAAYREALKGRGLKPIRLLAEKDDSQFQPPPEDDSQEQDMGIEDTLGIEPPASSQVVGEEESQSPVRIRKRTTTAARGASDEELPDLLEILEGGDMALPPASRARKGLHIPRLPRQRRLSVDPSQIFDIPSEGENSMPTALGSTPFAELENSPSPPLTGTTLTRIKKYSMSKHLRDRKAESPLLPTPDASSEPPSRKRPTIALSDSDSTTNDEVHDPHSQSASSEGEHGTRDLHRIQKRIRGVLPASWLKLDIGKNLATAVATAAGLSPSKRQNDKGVATVVRNRELKSAASRHALDDELWLYDQSDTAMSSPPPAVDAGHMFPQSPESTLRIVEDTIIEDNTIDTMRPIIPRIKNSQRPPRKRQKRLHDVFGVRDGNYGPTHTAPRPRQIKPRTNQSASGARPRNVRKNTAQLTILDAPGLANDILREHRPQFLRIAARRRNGRGPRPQDPRVKVLQLATREETEDINRELIIWERQNTTSISRTPTEPTEIMEVTTSLPSNVVQSHPDPPPAITGGFDANLQLLKSNTRSLLAQIDDRRQLDSSMADGTQAGPQGEARGPVLFSRFQSRRNRAGVGLLFHQGHQVRTTQLFGPSRNAHFNVLDDEARGIGLLAAAAQEAPLQQGFRLPSEQALHNDKLPRFSRSEHASRRRTQHPQRRKSAALSDHSLADYPLISSSEQTDVPLSTSATAAPNVLLAQTTRSIDLAVKIEDQLSSSRTWRVFAATTFVGSGSLVRFKNFAVASLQALGLADPSCQLSQSLSSEQQGLRHKAQDVIDLHEICRKATVYLENLQHLGDAAGDLEGVLALDLVKTVDHVLDSLSESPQHDYFGKQGIQLQDGISELYTIGDVWLASIPSQTYEFSKSSMSLLSRLLILSFLLLVEVSSKYDGDAWQAKAVDTYGFFAKLGVLAAVSCESCAPLLENLLVCAQTHPSTNSLLVDKIASRAESVVIIAQLSSLSSIGCTTMDGLVTWLLRRFTPSTPAPDLGRSLAIVGTVQLLTQIDEFGIISFVEHAKLPIAGWEIVVEQVERFLEYYVKKGKAKSPKEVHLGYATLAWLHQVAITWNWSEQKVLKAFFKAFAMNEMKNLFNTQRKPSSSVLEDHGANALRLGGQDSDFDIFLKLVALTLRGLQNDSSTADKKTGDRTRSLVFSLSPNSGRALHHSSAVDLNDLIALSNKYALYQTLYRYAPPGSKPRLTYVENLIDFGHSHGAVCIIAIDAWGMLTSICLADALYEDLKLLAGWMSRMLHQLKAKHVLARTEVLDVLMENAQAMSDEAHNVIRANQESTSRLLQRCIQQWSLAISRCPSVSQLTDLLSSGSIEEVLELLQTPLEHGAEVVESILQLLKACFTETFLNRRELTVYKALHDQYWHTLCSLAISEELEMHGPVLRSVGELWFSMADFMQKGRGSWDDYLDLHGSCSFTQLPDTGITRHIKTIFLARLVSQDRMYLDLNRMQIFTFWIEGLLLPNALFVADLTWQILQNDQEVLSLGELRNYLVQNDASECETSWLERERLYVVCFLIREIYCLQFVEAEDSFETGLNKDHGVMLLRVITKTMKSTWHKVHNTAKQSYWVDLIGAVLIELKVYCYAGFTIDPWYLDSRQFSSSQRPLLDELRLSPGRPRTQVTKQMVKQFRKQAESTMSVGGLAGLTRELEATFGCENSVGNTTRPPGTNIPLATKFVELVFPCYVESALSTEAALLCSIPIMSSLLAFVEHTYLRLNNFEVASIQEFWRVLLACVISMRKALQSVHPFTVIDGGFPVQCCFLGLVFKLTSVLLLQYHQLTTIVELEELNPDYCTDILEDIVYIYRYSLLLRPTPSVLPLEVGNLDASDLDHNFDLGSHFLSTGGTSPLLTEEERDIVSATRDDIRHGFEKEWRRDYNVARGWIVGSAKLQIQLDDHLWSPKHQHSVMVKEALALKESMEYVMTGANNQVFLGLGDDN